MNLEKHTDSIKFGVYGGLVSLLLYVILIFSGTSPWGKESWIGVWIPGMTVYFGLKAYKENLSESYVDFLPLFKIGILIVITQALAYNLLVFISESFLFDSSPIHIKDMLEQMKMTKDIVINFLGKQKYYQTLEEIEAGTLSSFVVGDFVNKFIGGTLVVAIIALVLRKKKPIFEE